MKATQVLSDEHRVIEHVLSAMQLMTKRITQGEQVRPGFFLDAADFIKEFADGCHHRKEEGVFFIALEKAGLPTQGGPVGVMLADHEKGREFTRKMKAATQKWADGDSTVLSQVLENAQGYFDLLQQHIYKEDNILFPMADKILPAEVQQQVLNDFERIEVEETGAGFHERYHAMAETLQAESLGKI